MRRSRGRAKRETLSEVLGPDDAERAFRFFEQDVDRRVSSGGIEPLPRARESLEALREGGVRILLTTGFSPRIRDGILDALGWSLLIDLALSPEDVGGRGRPDPDMILSGLSRLGIEDAREAAVVGDTVHDLVAGSRAGAAIVAGLLTGAHTREELAAAPHTHILDSIGDFPEIVLGRR